MFETYQRITNSISEGAIGFSIYSC